MFIQTEATPNPATLKFLPGRAVLEGSTLDLRDAEQAAQSPLAERLFGITGISAGAGPAASDAQRTDAKRDAGFQLPQAVRQCGHRFVPGPKLQDVVELLRFQREGRSESVGAGDDSHAGFQRQHRDIRVSLLFLKMRQELGWRKLFLNARRKSK